MRTSRPSPGSVRRVPLSRTARAALPAALLAAILVTCEESPAPTAADAAPLAAVRAAGGSGDGDSAAAAGGVTPQGTIPLPINQSISTSTSTVAFGITQTGTGGDGIFKITNTSNTQNALRGETNGSGIAVRGLATGAGGKAGNFEIRNAGNFNQALFATTNGTGPAGSFSVNNTASLAAAVNITSNGSGAALQATGTGTGNAATFTGGSANTGLATLFVENSFNNSAAFFLQDNPSGSADALIARADGSGKAGSFLGDVRVTGDLSVSGTLSKAAGSFRIDHPLDPEHKYLSHSFVESPDMLDVYDGNATLDGRGEAVVMLPAYFEALNRDFRYQLTPLGAPGPNLYVAQEIAKNRFVIAGGASGARVSWQVTGVRHDAYAEAHRIQVEEDKPAAEMVATRRER